MRWRSSRGLKGCCEVLEGRRRACQGRGRGACWVDPILALHQLESFLSSCNVAGKGAQPDPAAETCRRALAHGFTPPAAAAAAFCRCAGDAKPQHAPISFVYTSPCCRCCLLPACAVGMLLSPAPACFLLQHTYLHQLSCAAPARQAAMVTAAAAVEPTPRRSEGCYLGDVRVVGAEKGPLAGLTAVVKDSFDIAGHRTSNGSPAWLESHPPAERHAAAVQVRPLVVPTGGGGAAAGLCFAAGTRWPSLPPASHWPT